MKRIFTTFLIANLLLTAHAGLNLTVNSEDANGDEVITNITKDTTIVITNFEEDIFSGSVVMGVNGYLYSSDATKIQVSIERSQAGLKDEFCSGAACTPGNKEVKQELTVEAATEDNTWFTHYYPQSLGKETIAYSFDDGVNPVITLTVSYDYSGTAVEDVVVNPTTSAIYNLLGQRMPTTNWEELSSGIYVINGKKYIKK